MTIVDGLEPVEIEHEKTKAVGGPRCLGAIQADLGPFLETPSIAEVRERVGLRLSLDPGLQALLLGDVDRHPDDPGRLVIVVPHQSPPATHPPQGPGMRHHPVLGHRAVLLTADEARQVRLMPILGQDLRDISCEVEELRIGTSHETGKLGRGFEGGAPDVVVPIAAFDHLHRETKANVRFSALDSTPLQVAPGGLSRKRGSGRLLRRVGVDCANTAGFEFFHDATA